jgi:hypothetical protein
VLKKLDWIGRQITAADTPQKKKKRQRTESEDKNFYPFCGQEFPHAIASP